MFDYWHSGGHMWWMGTSWIVGLVMVALFIWAWMRGTGFQTFGTPESPEAVLKRRYAQGELTTEEYNRRLIELRT